MGLDDILNDLAYHGRRAKRSISNKFEDSKSTSFSITPNTVYHTTNKVTAANLGAITLISALGFNAIPYVGAAAIIAATGHVTAFGMNKLSGGSINLKDKIVDGWDGGTDKIKKSWDKYSHFYTGPYTN